VERVISYCNLEQELLEGNEMESEKLGTANNRPWITKGKVEYRDFSMRYRDGLPLVLNELSFVVEAANKVAIVGRTGSGKSSCILALFRMIEPCSGTILIDDINIQDISLHQLCLKYCIISGIDF